MLSSKAYIIHATTVLLKFDCGIQSIAGAVLPEVQSSYTCFDICDRHNMVTQVT